MSHGESCVGICWDGLPRQPADLGRLKRLLPELSGAREPCFGTSIVSHLRSLNMSLRGIWVVHCGPIPSIFADLLFLVSLSDCERMTFVDARKKSEEKVLSDGCHRGTVSNLTGCPCSLDTARTHQPDDWMTVAEEPRKS